MRRAFLSLLLPLLLAGCLGEPEPSAPGLPTAETPVPTTPEPSAPAWTSARGRALYREALAADHGPVGVEARVEKEGRQVAAYHGLLDEARDAAWMNLTMEPDAFEDPALKDDADRSLDEVARQGVDFHLAPEAQASVGGGFALVHPRDGRGLLDAMDAHPMLGMLAAAYPSESSSLAGVRVVRATPATRDGVPVVELAFRQDGPRERANGTFVVQERPPRVLEARVHLSGRGDALDGSHTTLRFSYGDDAPQVPARVMRAAGLAFQRQPLAGPEGAATGEEWVFLVDGGIPLAEVDLALMERGAEPDPRAGLRERARMPLSNGTGVLLGANATFTDADGDGLLSRGDTFRLDAPPEGHLFALRDTLHGTVAVPGPAAPLLLALLAGLALARRRALPPEAPDA